MFSEQNSQYNGNLANKKYKLYLVNKYKIDIKINIKKYTFSC